MISENESVLLKLQEEKLKESTTCRKNRKGAVVLEESNEEDGESENKENNRKASTRQTRKRKATEVLKESNAEDEESQEKEVDRKVCILLLSAFIY